MNDLLGFLAMGAALYLFLRYPESAWVTLPLCLIIGLSP